MSLAAMDEVLNVYREENSRLTDILASDTVLQTTQQELAAANARGTCTPIRST
jgi:hypothetical protein